MRDISRKIRANLRFKIQKGEYIGHAPYGYVKSGSQKNKLEVDPDTAGIIKEIFRMYLDGYGYAYIARWLDEKEVPSPSVKQGNIKCSKNWNAVAVQRILSNRVYIGDTVQGVSEKVSFKSKKTRRLPEEKWVITSNTHVPIITRKEFEDVQKLKNKKRSTLEPHKGVLHRFKGKLLCGGCKSKMFARKREGRPMSYICSKYGKYGKDSCSSHHIQEDDLVQVLIEELKELFRNQRLREGVIDRVKNDLASRADSTKEKEKLEQQLAAKQKQQDTLYMDKLEGKISEELFERTNTNLEQKIRILRQDIERMITQKKSEWNINELINQMLDDFSCNGITHEYIQLLIERITVYEGNDQLEGLMDRYPGKNYREEMRKLGAIQIDFKYSKP